MQATATPKTPGLRVLGSPGFRMLLAGLFLLVGLIVNALFITSMWAVEMPFLSDFEAYYDASRRLMQGEPLYFAEQLRGPVDAWCLDCYLYPPPLAQALVPLALLPMAVAKTLWFMLTTAAAFASTYWATGIGGAARSPERVLWCATATLLFFPVFLANSAGNVGALVALAATGVAAGGAAAGIGAALGALLKVVPGAFIPAVVVAPGRARIWLVATLVVVGGVSFVLAPAGWLEYPSVFLNMTAGSTDYERNLALANVAVQLDLGDVVVTALRALSLAIAGTSLALSLWLARRPGGMPMAALAASVTMLMVPGTLWPHYLVVLLPFAAMAWPRAGSGNRLALVAASGVLAIGCTGTAYAAAYVGMTALIALSGWVLWPRGRSVSA